MSEPVALVWSALIGGVFALMANWIAARLSRPKTVSEAKKLDAEAAQTVSEAALSLVEPLTKKVDSLQKTVEDLTVRVQVLETALQEAETALCDAETELYNFEQEYDQVISGANQLADQLVSLGANPVYKPPDRRGRTVEKP